MSSLLPVALDLNSEGFCVLKAAEDGTKSTDVGSWKPYQTQRPTPEQLAEWFRNGATGIGVLCGAISGNLEMLEFEGRAIEEGYLGRWQALVTDLAGADLFERVTGGYMERSPSGGVHLFYRVDGDVESNVKLAEREAFDHELTEQEKDVLNRTGRRARRTLIETRGEGGYVVIAPSWGGVHPSGQPWTPIVGTLPQASFVTVTERDALHMAAHELDSIPAPEPLPTTPRASSGGLDDLTPGEDFNGRAEWRDILCPHGWVPVRNYGGKTYWRRPGKRLGISAVTGGDSGDYLYVWSTSTELPPGESMSKWRVHAKLNHADDYSAAASDLRRSGYGAPLRSASLTDRDLSGLVPASVPDRPTEPSSEPEMGQPVSSWLPLDVRAVLAGDVEKPEPTVGRQAGLFYPARVHSIAAESEAGKTWLALLASLYEIRRGHHVVYLDFEDDVSGVVRRLIDMGAETHLVERFFHYIRPEQPMQAGTNAQDFALTLNELRPTLVTIDGVTEAMSMHGMEIKDNGDVARFGKMLPAALTKFGAAVVLLDHVIKDRDGMQRYAIGGAHKLNGLNGAAYILKNTKPFGEGVTGQSRVLIAKDRPAQLRKLALDDRDGLKWFADLIVASSTSGVAVSLKPAEASGSEFRPTHIMSLISNTLIQAGRPLTETEIYARLGPKVNKTAAISALSFLQDDEYVEVVEGRGTKYRHLRPFMKIV